MLISARDRKGSWLWGKIRIHPVTEDWSHCKTFHSCFLMLSVLYSLTFNLRLKRKGKIIQISICISIWIVKSFPRLYTSKKFIFNLFQLSPFTFSSLSLVYYNHIAIPCWLFQAQELVCLVSQARPGPGGGTDCYVDFHWLHLDDVCDNHIVTHVVMDIINTAIKKANNNTHWFGRLI